MRLIAIVRLSTKDNVVRVCQELVDAGLPAVEVTLTTPGALEAIRQLAIRGGGAGGIGAGSVRTPEDARLAQDAGASFLVTPTTRPDVIAAATVPVVCGALTPTEVDLAWSSGAAYVKLFPSPGPGYLKDILAPLPDIPLIPTGGVTLPLVEQYAAAGAVGVGVGSALVTEDIAELRRRAKAFVEAADAAWR